MLTNRGELGWYVNLEGKTYQKIRLNRINSPYATLTQANLSN